MVTLCCRYSLWGYKYHATLGIHLDQAFQLETNGSTGILSSPASLFDCNLLDVILSQKGVYSLFKRLHLHWILVIGQNNFWWSSRNV